MGRLGLLKGQIFSSILLSNYVLFYIVEVIQIALSCLLALENEIVTNFIQTITPGILDQF